MSGFPFPSCADFQKMPADEFESFWRTFEQMKPLKGYHLYRHDIRDACTLKRAGWQPEFDDKPQPAQLMSWYWRRPPRRKSGPGMLFKSPGQALGELRRSKMQASAAVRQFAVLLTIDGQQHRGSIPAKSPLHAQQLADSIGASVVQALIQHGHADLAHRPLPLPLSPKGVPVRRVTIWDYG